MKALTAADFNEKVLQSKHPSVVDFWAEWCGPCKMMLPVVTEIAEARKDVHFYKMNTDDCGDIAGTFRIMSIPCLVFISHGKEVDRLVGFNSKEKISSWLDQCLNQCSK